MKDFDFNEIDDFDKHIDLSIPNYDFLKKHLIFMIEALSENNTLILDLGCSTGSLLKELNKKKSCQYIGYDLSNLIENNKNIDNLKFIKGDITKLDYPSNASIISSIFTLQFIPQQERKLVIKKAFDSLNEGGYFIICEKTHSIDPIIENITNSIYYKYKRQNFTDTEILQKQQQLTNIMKLKTTKGLEDELKMFSHSEIFWKSYGFCGIIARK